MVAWRGILIFGYKILTARRKRFGMTVVRAQIKVWIAAGLMIVLGLQGACVQAMHAPSSLEELRRYGELMEQLFEQLELSEAVPFPAETVAGLLKKIDERPAYTADICRDLGRLFRKSYRDVNSDILGAAVRKLLSLSRADENEVRSNALEALLHLVEKNKRELLPWKRELLVRAVEHAAHADGSHWGLFMLLGFFSPVEGACALVGDDHIGVFIGACCEYLATPWEGREDQSRRTAVLFILSGTILQLEGDEQRALWIPYVDRIRVLASDYRDRLPDAKPACLELSKVCLAAL
jgi:hypothetical protein